MSVYCKKHKGKVPKECPRCLEIEALNSRRNINHWLDNQERLEERVKRAELLYADRMQEVLFLRQQTEELITSMGTQFKRIADAIAVKYELTGEKKEEIP